MDKPSTVAHRTSPLAKAQAPAIRVFLAGPIILLVLVALTASASAAGNAAVVVGGKADEGTRTLVQVSAAEALKTQGFAYLAAGDSLDERALVACAIADNTECTSKMLAPLGMDRTVLIAADAQRARDGEVTVILTAWLFSREGVVLGSDRRFCERCGTESLEESARDLVTELLRSAQAREGRSTLRITSNPPGAKVSVDGQAVGVTDLDYAVYPGPHTITIEKDGQLTMREVSPAPGETLVVAVRLSTIPSEPGRPPSPDKSGGFTKWIVGGAGAALLVGGVVLATMESPSTEDGVRLPEHTRYLWPGLGVATIGLGTMGVSAYLFYRDSKATDEQRSVVFVGPDGGRLWIGVSGRF